jgi:hypothetical protein
MNESNSESRSPALAGALLPPLAGPAAPLPRGLLTQPRPRQMIEMTHAPRGPPRPPRNAPLGALGVGTPPEILANKFPEGPCPAPWGPGRPAGPLWMTGGSSRIEIV